MIQPEIRRRLRKFDGNFPAVPVNSTEASYTASSFGQIRRIANNDPLTYFYFGSQGCEYPLGIQR